MKLILLIAMLAVASIGSASEIKKWVDSEGGIHYGDKPETVEVEQIDTLKIDDSFDQQAYDEAVQRNEEREQRLEELDKENEKAEKEATKVEEERREKLRTRRY
jgi:hypothetical protein